MRILVLEDEHLVAESLIKQITQLEPEAFIAGPLGSVAEAREYLALNQPDLIISDIQLSDGISLDVFTSSKPGCPIIFTTAFNEYAIRAFKVNSVDYLLKPIDRKELKAAFDKFHLLQSKFANDVYLQQISEMFNNFSENKRYKERFAVHSGRNVILVPAYEVGCFVKEEIIFLLNGEGRKLITDYRSLDEVEELLDPKQFFRANRQFLLQLSFIDSFRSDETGKINVKMKQSTIPEIIVSKEKAASFRKWVES